MSSDVDRIEVSGENNITNEDESNNTNSLVIEILILII